LLFSNPTLAGPKSDTARGTPHAAQKRTCVKSGEKHSIAGLEGKMIEFERPLNGSVVSVIRSKRQAIADWRLNLGR
jgi:hypothetical protein